jgi:NAD(P)-dependent dehydrogenase (short-subunit alcohol dehydrogenase family)
MSIILITGSSTGIGFAAAETLARNGHTVYATMRNPQRSPQLQQLANEENLPIIVLPMDVTIEASVHDTFAFVLSKEGHIDVLVNNAGIASWGAVEELSLEFFRADMETNYFGAIRCIKAVLPSMRQRKAGSIINVTSVAGKLYSNFHSTYCASKAALEAFSESLAQEVIPFDIRIALVEPEVIETPIFKKSNEIPVDTSYPNIKRFFAFFAASIENHIPPSAVADVINDIVSGKSKKMRNPAGPTAEAMLTFRASIPDEDWVNNGAIDEATWAANMEQIGLDVKKHMPAKGAAIHF